MKTKLALLCLVLPLAVFGQCGSSGHLIINPLTGLWDCTGNTTGAGSGTVTVVGAGSLTNTAIVTGGGSQTVQTAAPTATMDSSGNVSTPGTISAGVGSGVAGGIDMQQGTALSPPANSVTRHAPTSIATAYTIVEPTAAATGFFLGTNASNIVTTTQVGSTGSGNVVRDTSPTISNLNVTGSCTGCGGGGFIRYPSVFANNSSGIIGGWSVAGSNAPSAGNLGASPWNAGVLSYAAGATDINIASNQFMIPSNVDCAGVFTARVSWYPGGGSSVSEVMKWFVLTSFVADGTDSSVSPTFNTADTATSTLGASPIAKQITTTITLTNGATGCATGTVMRLMLKRDKNDAADTMGGAASAYTFELSVPVN